MVDVSDESIQLPPGFRFHPTDEEIVTHYLVEKFVDNSFTARAIGEVDLNKCEPWDLPKRAKMGGKEFYFFCQRDRKYPTGMRTNRATEAGYWKATGKDKEIYKGRTNCLIGMKKTLVFYRGRAPKGDKTNWVMHEYRLEGKFSYRNLPNTSKDEWVVCRVFHKSSGEKKSPMLTNNGLLRVNTFGDEFFDPLSLPPLYDPSRTIENNMHTNNKFTGKSIENQFLYCEDAKNFAVSNNNTLFPNTDYFSNPHLTAYNGSSQSGYLHTDMSGMTSADGLVMFRGLGEGNATYYDSDRQCKVEPFSCNQSMMSLSQDTGFSNDINNEISSVASKHEMGGDTIYQDFDGPSSSTAGLVDLECLWNY